ncbi:MAG: peptidoglycan synthetase [Saprospiraceae bacterium]|nr:peptidoglycan synthetase [Saprospiraceae bacterium]
MHNIALDLHAQGHHISGSDDEIYEPSLSRLKNKGLAPDLFGWFEANITDDIDMVILGMHAKADNPELLKAQKLGIKIYSYPAFIYEHAKNKQRVVIAGSHGKTTTTAMILHVLKKLNFDFDFLVGAQIEGFDRMVKLTSAPLIIIEGDEYLSSPIDRVPKIHHYKPHISVITGIAWDHINVFPTFENYKKQFAIYLDTMEKYGKLIYNKNDKELTDIVRLSDADLELYPYGALQKSGTSSIIHKDINYPISIIGNHNLQNLNAARLVCASLKIDLTDFFDAIKDFGGASKRLQKLSENDKRVVFLDFAHAPSKVMATTTSVKEWFGSQKLLAVLELHTFSSLNKDFIPQYRDSLLGADTAVVFYNEHTLKMKNMPPLDERFLQQAFNHPNLKIFTDEALLNNYLAMDDFADFNVLLMTSGNFNKMAMDFF